jgi:hypothetical protein
VAVLVGTPSGHIGIIIYAENLSFAFILSTILRAISIGIKLFAPAERYICITTNSMMLTPPSDMRPMFLFIFPISPQTIERSGSYLPLRWLQKMAYNRIKLCK